MRFGPVPLDEAEGKILGHNIAGPDGRRVLRKGKPLTLPDVSALREIGRETVYVAELESGDVGEDAAARRVAQAVTGPGLRLSGPASGRINLLATVTGMLRVDLDRLNRINECEGITLATLAAHTPVRPRQIIATVKVIPFAVPEASLLEIEKLAAGEPLIRVDELQPRKVALILSGSPWVRARVAQDFEPPLRARIEALGSTIRDVEYVPLEDKAGETVLAQTLCRHVRAGAGLILLAGETAIMDRHDIAPRAVERAGGRVECVGAPVDPGNLLMLAYLDDVPVLGAPGCARSRRPNVIDWLLPRLLAGDRLSRTDITALGHGGLLEDVPERPNPRNDLDGWLQP